MTFLDDSLDPSLDLTPKVSIVPRKARHERASQMDDLVLLPDPGESLEPGLNFPAWLLGVWAMVVLSLGLLGVWAMVHPFGGAAPMPPSAVQQLMHAGTVPAELPTPMAHPSPAMISPDIVYRDPVAPTLATPIRQATARPTPTAAETDATSQALCLKTTRVLLAHAHGNPVLVNGRQVHQDDQIEPACNLQHQEPPSLVFTVGG